jgi:pentatricopeptide repeat protein
MLLTQGASRGVQLLFILRKSAERSRSLFVTSRATLLSVESFRNIPRNVLANGGTLVDGNKSFPNVKTSCCRLSSTTTLRNPSASSSPSSTPTNGHPLENDFQKWQSISKKLVEQETPWSQGDMRYIEQCLLHWSSQRPLLNTAMREQYHEHTLVRLWKRLEAGHEHEMSRVMYDYAVHALARWGFPILAEECLQAFLAFIDRQPPLMTLRLNIPAKFHTKAISRSYESLGRPEECEAFVRRCLENPRTCSLVDENTVHRALYAWRNAGSGERAEALLKWVAREHKHVKLQIEAYSTVCMAWGRTRGRNDAGVRAEQFLKEMPMKPDPGCWTGVLMAWTNIPKQPEGLHYAVSLLWHAVQERAVISEHCFHEILSAHGRQGMADRAVAFLEQWIHDATQSDAQADILTPNIHSFNCVIHALAKGGSPDAGEKAHALMRDMAEKYSMTPDAYTYNSVLAAYAKTGNTEAVSDLLQQLEQTNWQDVPLGDDLSHRAYAYTSLIQAWLERSQDVKTDDQRLSFAIKAASVLDRMTDHGITPPAPSYNMVINAFGFCNSEQGAAAAEDLLYWMLRNNVPIVEEYGMKVINAWARIGSYQRAHALLRRLEKHNIKIGNKQKLCGWYNCVILAYSKSLEPQCAEEANAILTQLVSSDDLPNPDEITYAITLACWRRSKHPDKASRAWDVLQQLLRNFDDIRKASRHGIDTEKLILNAHVDVLWTCASVPLEAGTEQRELALNIALQVFSQIPTRDSRVYYAALKAFGKLLENPAERYGLLRSVFLEYARNQQPGDLDERVLNAMQTMLPINNYSALMEEIRVDPNSSKSETN